MLEEAITLIKNTADFNVFEKPDGLSKQEFIAYYRQTLLATQDWLLEHPESLGPEDFPTKHYFCEGVYIRQLFVPEGVFLIGRTHKTKHLNIVLSGAVNVVVNGEMKLVEAPGIFESEPHTKRAGYVLRDMLWATVHQTTETDVKKIENDICYSFEEEKQFLADEMEKLKLLGEL